MGGYAGTDTPDPDERDISLYPSILDGDLTCVLAWAVGAAIEPAAVHADTDILYVDDDGCGDGLSWETAAFDLRTSTSTPR